MELLDNICGSYQDFLDRGLLQTRKLLHKLFLLVKCHKWPQLCCKHSPVLSTFMTYHRVCHWNNSTGATSGGGTAYTSWAREFIPGFNWGSCCAIFSFCVVFCLSFCPFFFAIVLSIFLWFTASGFPFGIFKFLAITVSVLWFTAFDYTFGIFKRLTIALYILIWFMAFEYHFDIFNLWAIVFSVLLRFTTSDYLFDIFKLWATVLSVLLRFTTSDYLFDIFKLFIDNIVKRSAIHHVTHLM